jgi:uncharacterized protein with von Willebrand factor type A (vWA) domain
MQRETRHNPCSDLANRQLEMLREIAKMQMGQGLDYDSKIMDAARKRAQRRFQESRSRKERAEEDLEHLEAEEMQRSLEELMGSGAELDNILGSMDSGGHLERVKSEITDLSEESQQMTQKDFDDALSEFGSRGLTDSKKPKITLTSKGARLLGQGYLSRILQRLSRRGVGPHKIQDIGYGPWLASTVRPYEVGDPYDRISILHSLFGTLERGAGFQDLSLEDFRVFEAIHSTQVTFGILVDQSASMNRAGKLESSVETALALNELLRSQFPEDRLRLFAFSEEVKEVESWELPGIAVPMRYTDVRAAMHIFRKLVAHETGNKQAHLITDSAPNYEDGEYVGFDAAFKGVVEEARRYRSAGITLNIVMLDDDPKLGEMAKSIAQENLGRVFFVRPGELGEALVEDYLVSKREFLRL